MAASALNSALNGPMTAFKMGVEAINKSIENLNKTISTIVNGLAKSVDERKAIENLEFEHAVFKMRQIKKEQDFLISAFKQQIDYSNALFKKNTLVLEQTKKLYQLEKEVLNIRKSAADSVLQFYKGVSGVVEPLTKLTGLASQFSREIGGSQLAIKKMRDETLRLVNSGNFQMRYNVSTEDLLKLTLAANKSIGRNIGFTNNQNESIAALKSVYGDERAVEFVSKLSTFGQDADKAAGIAGKMFANATKYGISLEKYSKNFLSNIKMAQTLTFAKGVSDLQKMAEKAAELNLNMQETAKVADKFTTLESAMEASAQLSVLGGNFSAFSNPLAIMNEAFNDAESLQDRLVNMFSGLARWDSEKGQISMTGFDRQRLKVASQAMGVDADSVYDMIFEKARRDRLLPEVNSLGMGGDMTKLLLNIAQLDEHGNGYVTHNGEKLGLSEIGNLSPDELRSLIVRNSSDSDNIQNIAESLMTIKDNLEGFTKKYNDLYGESIKSNEEAIIKDIQESAKNNEELIKHIELSKDVSLQQLVLAKNEAMFNDRHMSLTLAHRKRMIELERWRGEMDFMAQKYNYEIDLPIKQQQLVLELEQAKRADEMYRLNRIMLQLEANKFIKDSLGGGLIGNIAGALHGMFGTVSVLGNLVNGWKRDELGGIGSAFKHMWKNKTSYDDLVGETIDKSKIPTEFHKLSYAVRDVNEHTGADTKYYETLNGNFGGNLSSQVYGNGKSGVGNLPSEAGGAEYVNTASTNVPNYIIPSAHANGGIIKGPSHANGGVTVNVEGGEYVIPKSKVPYYTTTLDAIRDGRHPHDGKMGGDVNLNVGGTIKLELNGSSVNLNADELLRDPVFLRKLAYEITKSSEDRNNFGYNGNSRIFGI